MRSLLLPAILAALAAVSFPAAEAHACGGVFCDRVPPGQPPMPVDQKGENVLFVVNGSQVEAHVQIQYMGDPERFAWVVPMPRVPAVSVGSQRLFTNLLQGTVPTFQLQTTFATCRNSFNTFRDSGGCASGSVEESSGDFAASPTAAGGKASPGGGLNGGPTVVERASVGAFEYAILESMSAQDLAAWLEQNQFEVPASTETFLRSYVEQSFVFVAVKLAAGKGIDEIHPLVFTYDGDQPCVPLKLTAVAATEDMGVRTFFLGQERYVPKNYKHVTVNEAWFDWSGPGGFNSASGAAGGSGASGPGANYTTVISRAVDSPVASGRAFVTEFAGATLPPPPGSTPAAGAAVSSVTKAGLYSPQWQPSKLVTSTHLTVVDELVKQGLMTCNGSGSSRSCTGAHPQAVPVLRRYLPPAKVSEQVFYGCVSCYQKEAPAEWDAEAFAAEVDARIVKPGKHAEDLLGQNPYLTRMFTTISPAEMTEDPEFVRIPRADVSQVHTATRQVQCDGTSVGILADGREIALKNDNTWPAMPASMPIASRIEEFSASGQGVLLQDNTASVQSETEQFNKSRGWPPDPEFTVDESSNNCSLGYGRVRNRTTSALLLGAAAVCLLGRRLRRSR